MESPRNILCLFVCVCVFERVPKVWDWEQTDEIFPCRVYLRHCLLATKKQGDDVFQNFIENTYLNDRKTTIKQYLTKKPKIWDAEPPEALANRYNG